MSVSVRRRTRALVVLTLGLGLVLAACGDGGDDTDARAPLSATEHNEADVAFATDMVQHHAQAMAMVDLTVRRPLDPQVQQLAESIREAQGPEIELMVDWLQEWDEEVPETVNDHAHAGHGGDEGEPMEDMPDMPGMMTAEDMTALEEASDAEFQERWLELMVEHHAGAVEMARAQEAEGRYRPAVELAGDVIESQTAEIEQMEALLGQ